MMAIVDARLARLRQEGAVHALAELEEIRAMAARSLQLLQSGGPVQGD
jgi:hypothetical protein